METLQKQYRVDKTQIGFIRFIFEAHEGVAVVSTLDAKQGLIQLAISPELETEAMMIVEDLKKEFLFDDA